MRLQAKLRAKVRNTAAMMVRMRTVRFGRLKSALIRAMAFLGLFLVLALHGARSEGSAILHRISSQCDSSTIWKLELPTAKLPQSTRGGACARSLSLCLPLSPPTQRSFARAIPQEIIEIDFHDLTGTKASAPFGSLGRFVQLDWDSQSGNTRLTSVSFFSSPQCM